MRFLYSGFLMDENEFYGTDEMIFHVRNDNLNHNNIKDFEEHPTRRALS